MSTLTEPLYSYDAVRNMTRVEENASSSTFQYVLDDLTWECEYSVKCWESQQGNVKKALVIHMPNDGYFYINGVAVEQFLWAKMTRRKYSTDDTATRNTKVGRFLTRLSGRSLLRSRIS